MFFSCHSTLPIARWSKRKRVIAWAIFATVVLAIDVILNGPLTLRRFFWLV